MDLLQLRYFQVVARLEHMTRAAEELHIAQPSLSKTISRLEEQLRVPLFDRNGKQIRLNAFGKAFLQRVDRIFQELKDGQQELADMSGLERGLVQLGTTTTRLLPNLLFEYLQQYPQVNIRLLQVTTKETMSRLEKGEIDLLISSPPVKQPGIHCLPLLEEEIFLAVSPHHRLARRKHIHLHEVAADPFISLTSDYDYRAYTLSLCKQAGFQPNIAFESNDPDVILSMAYSGLGVAMIPAHWWKKWEETTSPVRLRLKEPECTRVIGLAWVESRYLSVAACDVRSFIIQYFSRLAAKT